MVSAAPGGGVELTVNPPAEHDFNGDGVSDILWRQTNGTVDEWLGQRDGSFANNGNASANPVDSSWQIAGFGDFNGDGRDDIVWRHTSGAVAEWQGQSDGSFINTSNVMPNAVDSSWQIVGIGDFNGDGHDDIFWRHTATGTIDEWLGQSNGGFSNNAGAAANVVGTDWSIAAVGDFNGDGYADVLWEHSSKVFDLWTGTATGAFVNSGAVLSQTVGQTDQIVGTGDFNGDGVMDVLGRNGSTGEITEFLGQSNGQFTSVTPSTQLDDPNWKIAQIGDFNGDGLSDILWRHTDGADTLFLSTGHDFTSHSITSVDTSWTVQSPDSIFA